MTERPPAHGHTRRQALAELTLGAAALALAGCGARSADSALAPNGSTLASTYLDPRGDGVLQAGPGAKLIDRTELAPRVAAGAVRATIAHLTDAHVMDEQSPARVPFLRRLGSPFNSTFRPQEALAAHVLAGAVRAIDLLRPDAVIQGGDLIDNAQGNELTQALALLHGGSVNPNSGGPGYTGVQSAQDPDPLYYRPDIDAPRHPGLLERATARFTAGGLRAPWYPVLGDHDLLVQGVLAPSPLTQAIALGSRAVWDLPLNLHPPRGFSATATGTATGSPDGLSDPQRIGALIEQLQEAPSVAVAADPTRRELTAAEVIAALRSGSGSGGEGPLMNYSFDVGARVRVIVLDLVRREGGSGGVVHEGLEAWLAGELARAGGRWVLVVSHQPLTSTEGAERLLALLDRDPRVAAAIWGHTHRNRIVPRQSVAGGYWLIATCSLIDYPQQLRAIRLRDASGGGCVLETWMLDHVPDGGGIGDISRELSYIDAQGGRPQGFAGGPLDRNVRLYKR
jgi:3',5'-cyclic AMP phosphodiesterase CpdA